MPIATPAMIVNHEHVKRKTLRKLKVVKAVIDNAITRETRTVILTQIVVKAMEFFGDGSTQTPTFSNLEIIQ